MPEKVKLSEVKAGDKLVADNGFTCIDEGQVLTVLLNCGKKGGLYVPCRDGKHFLDGQKADDGTLVGLTRP